MPLNITTGGMSARGFGFTTQGYYGVNLTISSNTTSYNVRTAALAAGWSGTNPLNVSITINAGVTVSGTGNGTSAAILLTNLVDGSIVTINNNGTIVGSAGSAGYKTSNSGAESYPGNYTGSFVTPNFPNNYGGTGYPTGPGAGGSTPGYNTFSGGTTASAGSGTAGGSAIYLASNVYLVINNSATGLVTGGGGGAGGQAGNNAGGGSGGNGGYCIEETGAHPAAIANNISGGIISSGGGGSPGWGNRYEGDGVGGRPGNPGIAYILSVGNFGAVGSSPGLATNNTGTSLINTTGQFTLSPTVTNAVYYTSQGTYTLTIPSGITSMSVTVAGAGGGGGGDDGAGPGYSGFPGQVVSKTNVAVTPGQIITSYVGGGGGHGNGGTNKAGGTAGVDPSGTYSGGRGGNAGPSGYSGSGGGGGAGSSLLIAGSTYIVAGGGGGGGGGDLGAPGKGQQTPFTYNSTTTGEQAADPGGDTSAGGGGGGGSTYGGAAGASGGGGGSWSGINGQSLVPSGATSSDGGNGGANSSTNGGDGYIIIIY